jgi:hypothetical protein
MLYSIDQISEQKDGGCVYIPYYVVLFYITIKQTNCWVAPVLCYFSVDCGVEMTGLDWTVLYCIGSRMGVVSFLDEMMLVRCEYHGIKYALR